MTTFVTIGGVLQFGILIASALVPQVLDWRTELRKLPTLFAQLVWVHGGFIVLTIAGFGLLSIASARELASGTALGRSVCGMIGLFWGARLGVQIVYFHPQEYLSSTLLKLGYHALTAVFTYLAIVFSWIALA